MSTSLVAFKSRMYRELYEGLEELFDSEPSRRSFTFVEYPDQIEVEPFGDGKGNEIKVYFYKIGKGLYDADFMLNGDSYGEPKTGYSIRDYSILLNTIAAVFSEFLEKYQPEGLILAGIDSVTKVSRNPSVEGQKDRIYNAFISRVVDVETRYRIGRDRKTGTLELVRK